MKLHKINKEGSLAVVLPKKTIERLGWKQGDYIEVLPTEDKTKLIIINCDK